VARRRLPPQEAHLLRAAAAAEVLPLDEPSGRFSLRSVLVVTNSNCVVVPIKIMFIQKRYTSPFICIKYTQQQEQAFALRLSRPCKLLLVSNGME
jgi:hypothetical protein